MFSLTPLPEKTLKRKDIKALVAKKLLKDLSTRSRGIAAPSKCVTEALNAVTTSQDGELDLEYAELTETDIMALCTFGIDIQELRVVNLRSATLRPSDGKFLWDLVNKNPSIEAVDLEGTMIAPTMISRIESQCENNKVVKNMAAAKRAQRAADALAVSMIPPSIQGDLDHLFRLESHKRHLLETRNYDFWKRIAKNVETCRIAELEKNIERDFLSKILIVMKDLFEEVASVRSSVEHKSIAFYSKLWCEREQIIRSQIIHQESKCRHSVWVEFVQCLTEREQAARMDKVTNHFERVRFEFEETSARQALSSDCTSTKHELFDLFHKDLCTIQKMEQDISNKMEDDRRRTLWKGLDEDKAKYNKSARERAQEVEKELSFQRSLSGTSQLEYSGRTKIESLEDNIFLLFEKMKRIQTDMARKATNVMQLMRRMHALAHYAPTLCVVHGGCVPVIYACEEFPTMIDKELTVSLEVPSTWQSQLEILRGSTLKENNATQAAYKNLNKEWAKCMSDCAALDELDEDLKLSVLVKDLDKNPKYNLCKEAMESISKVVEAKFWLTKVTIRVTCEDYDQDCLYFDESIEGVNIVCIEPTELEFTMENTTLSYLNTVLRQIGYEAVEKNGDVPRTRPIQFYLEFEVKNGLCGDPSLHFKTEFTEFVVCSPILMEASSGGQTQISKTYLARSVDDLQLFPTPIVRDIPIILSGRNTINVLTLQEARQTAVHAAAAFEGCTLMIDIVDGYSFHDQIYLSTFSTLRCQGGKLYSGDVVVGIVERGTFHKIAKTTSTFCCPSALRVRFTSNLVDSEMVQSFLRDLRFCNLDINATPGERQIEISLSTKFGMNTIVVVVDVSTPDIPTTLEIPEKTIVYRGVSENDLLNVEPNIISLAPQARVIDPDTDHFEGGYLFASIVKGYCNGDTLTLVDSTPESSHSQRGVYVKEGCVFFDGVQIGTVQETSQPISTNQPVASPAHRGRDESLAVTRGMLDVPTNRIGRRRSSGSSRAPLGTASVRVTFSEDGNASILAAQECVRRICYSANTLNPKPGTRVVHLELFVGATLNRVDDNGNTIDTTTAVNEELREKINVRVFRSLLRTSLKNHETLVTEGSGTRKITSVDVIPTGLELYEEIFDGGYLKCEFVSGAAKFDVVSLKGTADVSSTNSTVVPREPKMNSEENPPTPRLVRAPFTFSVSKDRGQKVISTEETDAILERCPQSREFLLSNVDHYEYFRLGVPATQQVPIGDLFVNHDNGSFHLYFRSGRGGLVNIVDVQRCIKSLTFTSFAEGCLGERKVRISLKDAYGSVCVLDTSVRVVRSSVGPDLKLPPPQTYRFNTTHQYPFASEPLLQELILRRRDEGFCTDVVLPLRDRMVTGPVRLMPFSKAKVTDEKQDFWDGGFVVVELVTGAMLGDTISIMDMEQQKATWEIYGKYASKGDRMLVRLDDKGRISITTETEEVKELNLARLSFPMNQRYNGVSTLRVDFPKAGKKAAPRVNVRYVNTILNAVCFLPSFATCPCAGERTFRVVVHNGKDDKGGEGNSPFGRGTFTVNVLPPLLFLRDRGGRFQTSHNLRFCVSSKKHVGIQPLAKHMVSMLREDNLLQSGYIEFFCGNDFNPETDEILFKPSSMFTLLPGKDDGFCIILMKGEFFCSMLLKKSYMRVDFKQECTLTSAGNIESLLQHISYNIRQASNTSPQEMRTLYAAVTDGALDDEGCEQLHIMKFDVRVEQGVVALASEEFNDRAQTPLMAPRSHVRNKILNMQTFPLPNEESGRV